jgi:hypothetical protein
MLKMQEIPGLKEIMNTKYEAEPIPQTSQGLQMVSDLQNQLSQSLKMISPLIPVKEAPV